MELRARMAARADGRAHGDGNGVRDCRQELVLAAARYARLAAERRKEAALERRRRRERADGRGRGRAARSRLRACGARARWERAQREGGVWEEWGHAGRRDVAVCALQEVGRDRGVGPNGESRVGDHGRA